MLISKLTSVRSISMKNDIAGHSMLLRAIGSSMCTTTKAICDVQHKVSDSVSKLEMVWKELPTALGYAWGPELPILLIDGLGRKSCLPLMLVKNSSVWIPNHTSVMESSCSASQTFRDVLLIMHRDAPGYERIQKGKYVVSNEDAKGTLIQREKWNEIVRPGMHIGLSFVLKHPGMRESQECLRCKSLQTTLSYRENRRRWYDDW